MTKPAIIFCNLQNSGSSAIDPLFRELLVTKDYYVVPYGPEGTQDLRPQLGQGLIPTPFYHWTHDPVETFEGLIGSPEFRFIYLHRDPRDAAVSQAFDLYSRKIFGNLSFRDTLKMVIARIQPGQVEAAVKWAKSDCMVITFDQMKTDLVALMRHIFEYCGLMKDKSEDDLANIARSVENHSFEKITGRKRGSPGEIIRTGYMFRTGISGDWKNHFDQELLDLYNTLMGDQTAALGYDLITQINANSGAIA